ncbi:MAG: UbiD family decarboxylase [Desulfobacterales bacterium]|nr:UbiD family decarboxylase [Desulfobacterales bacterium]
MPYKDLRQYITVLENRGKLHRVTKTVDKDWEIAAVCRHLFETVPGAQRPALLFESVAGFAIPVLVNAIGGSREIYALGLDVRVEDINHRWDQGLRHPLAPSYVDYGPCKENILAGDDADLTRLPVPVWVAAHDPGPYITAPYVCTKDPDTGRANLGTCRMQVKGPRRAGVCPADSQSIGLLNRNAARGVPTPCAVVIGADPVVGMVSAATPSYGMDAYMLAGGLRGQPLELTACQTVDIAVPATAEIVIEGHIPTDREAEGPFGETTGYMSPAGNCPYIDITCITYRNNPIYQAFFSQMPPSELSRIHQIGRERMLFYHLRTLGLPVRDVHFPESGASAGIIVISIGRLQYPGQARQIMNAAWGLGQGLGKFTIVVDDDIDIRDSFAVEWAVSFRSQPERDDWIVGNLPARGPDPSRAPSGGLQQDPYGGMSSIFAIDATRKHPYPPMALPPGAHLDEVDKNWQKYGFN